MNLHLRRLVRISLASSLLLAGVFPACAKRGEGERCDKALAGDDDCEDGLICVEADLLGGEADRCCPPGSTGTGECLENPNGAGGTAGTGGSGGSAGNGGSAGIDGSAGSAGSDAGDGSAGSDGSADPDADASNDAQDGSGGTAGTAGSGGQLDDAAMD